MELKATVVIGRKRDWGVNSNLLPIGMTKAEPIATGYTEMKDLLDSVGREDNLRLLDKCARMYDALATFREKRERCWRYAVGDQWSDKIVDPDDPQHRLVTEGEYIKRQGKLPLKNNVITPLIKSTLGIYRGNKKEPIAICRDRDEAKLGDMMSIALQYVYQCNQMDELNARELQESLSSAMFLAYVGYEWNDDRKRYEVFCRNEDQNRVFFNGDVDDPRFRDLTTIGFIRDMDIDALVQKFAGSRLDAERIRNEYKYVDQFLQNYLESLDTRKRVTSFYVPQNTAKCRVIEVWTKETKERLRCHDVMNGEVFVCECDEKAEIDRINAERKAQYVAQGMSEEDAPLIVDEWFIDRYWYVRYLSPLGEVICEKRSPFTHGSHPYVLKVYPMIGGESHSFVDEIIDQQRYVNRYITMMDYITGASAKGMLLIPDGSLPDNMDVKDLMREWSKPDSAMVYKWKAGMPTPTHISASGVQSSHIEMLNIQLKMLEDISGVHAAMQGQAPNSGTPSSLYAMQAQNSSNNLTDFISWFDTCVSDRDYKILKTIQQYFNEYEYISIAGHDYEEESKWYDPERIKNSEFDITISEATATPAYRNVLNDFLMQMFQSGAIDAKMLMENVNMPFAPKLLEAIKKREEEQMQMQQQMQSQQGGAVMPQQGSATADTGGGVMTQQEANQQVQSINSPEVRSMIDASIRHKKE